MYIHLPHLWLQQEQKQVENQVENIYRTINEINNAQRRRFDI